MNLQKIETPGKWLFGIAMAGGIVFSTSAIEFLPFIVGFVFLTALPGFHGFRRQIRWRRMFLLSVVAVMVLLGMYYWAIRDNSDDLVADFCLWAAWPLIDEDTGAGVPLAWWLPFWVMKGLLFGFIIESFCSLSKQRGVKRIEACVRRDSEAEGDVPPFGLAGILCMASLAIVFWAMRCQAGLWPQWNEWLLSPLIIIVPTAIAFITLHRSSWQRESPVARRVVAIALRSGVIVGVVLFIVLLILVAMSFLASQDVPRGQYGEL